MIRLIDETTIKFTQSGWDTPDGKYAEGAKHHPESITVTSPDGFEITISVSEWISDVIVSNYHAKPVRITENDLEGEKIILL